MDLFKRRGNKIFKKKSRELKWMKRNMANKENSTLELFIVEKMHDWYICHHAFFLLYHIILF